MAKKKNDAEEEVVARPQYDAKRIRGLARDLANSMRDGLTDRKKLHAVWCFQNHPGVRAKVQQAYAADHPEVAEMSEGEFLAWLKTIITPETIKLLIDLILSLI